VDRAYIEDFLSYHAVRIRGRVLEVGEDTYTRHFGGRYVESCDVLHAVPGNPAATIVADLANAPCIPDAQYDCIVITQTLQMIFDVRAAVRTLYRILKPGGTALATLPGISQISRSDMAQWGDFWRFTSASSWRMFAETFTDGEVTIKTYGNVLAAAAFLYGLAREDLATEELTICDPDYQVLIGVCAVKTDVAAGAPRRG
jgi:SAM-dependent methyltransferase